jgi:hypothetical protein
MNWFKRSQQESESGLEDLEGNLVPLNDDGTITLYHMTDSESAQQIRETGNFTSKENTGEAYFSTHPNSYASGYGNEVVTVKAPPSITQLNDAFRNGEVHVTIKPTHFNQIQIV